MTKGARLMLWTPPPTNPSPSPQVLCWAAPAIALQPRAWHLDRQPGDQRGMARDAAAVLAALIAAADHDILDLVGRKAALGDDLGNDAREHVVGPHLGERAGMPAERASETGIHIGVEHGAIPP